MKRPLISFFFFQSFIFTLLLVFSASFIMPGATAQTKSVKLRIEDQTRRWAIPPRLYDSGPSFIKLTNGTLWVTWHVYERHKEKSEIVARSFHDGKGSLPIMISKELGIYGDPKIARSKDGTIWVVWPSYKGGHWTLWARAIINNQASESYPISSIQADAAQTAAVLSTPDGLYVAWSSFFNGHFHIMAREWKNGKWGKIAMLSQSGLNAFRPALSKDIKGNIWIFWDAYKDGRSAIYGRKVTPNKGPIEQISPPDNNRYLLPVAASAKHTGLCVAWVRVVDIIGGEGAIDQWHTMQMATHKGGHWELVHDSNGNTNGAIITRGLLAKIKPNPVPTGGYLGHRLYPMLLKKDGYLWLVWERKTNQEGSTHFVTGDLIGRQFNGLQWENPRVFCQGYVDYRIPTKGQVKGDVFTVIASKLPLRYGQRTYVFFEKSLKNYTDFKQEKWLGWKPVQLPLHPQSHKPRFEVHEGNKIYKLYWMDSHVHTGLTPDAEGFPDVLLFYARDRAQLDAIVMQDNDYYTMPLTRYEYQVGKFFCDALSSSDFLALHGFEWTSRLPSNKNVNLAKPFFWGKTYPNHRTVIYPNSNGPIVPYIDVDNDITQLYDTVSKYRGVVLTQHPKFKLTGNPVEVGVEVASGWGTFFLKPDFIHYIHSLLNEGYRFGFVGTGDSHRRNPGLNGGLTGILAEDLTSKSILEAYHARRFYATNGSKVGLEARANGVLMGQEAKSMGSVNLSLRVNALRPIVRVVLIRNGKKIATFKGKKPQQQTFNYNDSKLKPGVYWYYWRIELTGGSEHYGGNVQVAKGNLAWSTPNWVKVK